MAGDAGAVDWNLLTGSHDHDLAGADLIDVDLDLGPIDGDDLSAMNVWTLPPGTSSHRRPAAKSAMYITTFAISFKQLWGDAQPAPSKAAHSGDVNEQPKFAPAAASTSTTRSDNDTWDLKSSVGTTATMVATARAVASREPNAIIADPFAAPLVRAVGIDVLSQLVDGDIEQGETGDEPDLSLQPMIDSFAVRTRFFDEFFTAAADAGIRQAVILASGLDSRTYRLPWQAGSVVYEIDLPSVLEFKTRTLSGLGAEPKATYRPVAVDLRDDWLTALRNNGFDATEATAWSAEGLLMYLPPDAQDRLFDNITALSAPGSRLATDYQPDAAAAIKQRTANARAWSARGLDLDTTQLIYQGDRSPVPDYLAARRWRVSAQSRADLFGIYGLTNPDENAMPNNIAVTAVLEQVA